MPVSADELGLQRKEDKGKGVSAEELGFKVRPPTKRPPEVDVPPEAGYPQLKEQSEQARQDRAQKREQTLQNALGPRGGYEEGGFEDFSLEVDLARSDRFSEKRRKFKSKYPDGNLIKVPVAGEIHLYGRKNPSSKYKEVGGFGPAATAMAPEIGASVLGGLPGGIRGVVGAAGASALAEYGGQKIDEVRGFQDDTERNIRTQALKFGLLEGGIDLALRGLGLGGRFGKLAREADVRPPEALSDFIEKEGLEQIPRGQASDIPFVMRSYQQSASTSAIPQRKSRKMRDTLMERFSNRAHAFDETAITDKDLSNIVQASVRQLDSIVKPGKLNRTQAGKDLVKGLETFHGSSKEWVSRKYAKAFEADNDVFFDISGVQDVTQDLTKKITSQGIQGEDVVIKSIEDLPSDLQRQIQKIQNMNPTVASWKGESGFNQLKELRTQLYDLKNSDDAATARVAGRIYGAMTDAMRRPVGGNEEFVRKFVSASKANAWREGILEKGYIANFLNKTTDSSEVVDRYFASDKRDELRVIKRLVPQDRWDSFVEQYKNKLLKRPTKISETLDNFDDKTSDVIFPKGTQDALKKYEKEFNKIDQGMFKEIAESSDSPVNKSIRLIRESSPEEITNAVKLSGKGSKFVEHLKWGVYQDILRDSKKVARGEEVLDPALLKQNIHEWKKSGKLESFMNKNDWSTLSNYEKYASLIDVNTKEVGASLHGAEAVAGARKGNPVAAWTMFNDAVTARILASNPQLVKKIPNIEKLSPAKIRATARALGAFAFEMKHQDKEEPPVRAGGPGLKSPSSPITEEEVENR